MGIDFQWQSIAYAFPRAHIGEIAEYGLGNFSIF